MTSPIRGNEGPDIEWVDTFSGQWSTYLNKSHDLVLDLDVQTGEMVKNSSFFDPYFSHNSTIKAAIDASPQWLNRTLSWKFHDINSYNTWKYTSLLTDPNIDIRYIDEIAFYVAYSSPDSLNSYFTVPDLIVENIEMMYEVEKEVTYASITDTVRSDGQHSTVVYSTPSGNVTLPEDIYYRYLMMPRSEMEQASYINLTTFKKTNDPSMGLFWRSFLYTADDPGYPVLRELLLNESNLWNGTKNMALNNGAVGAVTQWESQVMSFGYMEGMRRDHQPISLYKQHIGLCGENAEVLVAAAKTALIPTVVTINFDMMHAWNEFYDRGWHQWEGYSQRIDDPMAEGMPGSVTVMTNMDPDETFFTNTDLYTPTTNLTVVVRDVNGIPVDGAMVKILSQPSANYYGIIPLLGNATDVNGEAGFMVGSNFAYFVQVLSPIEGWLNETSYLPLAFPTTSPGGNHVFNVTLNTSMPLNVNLSALQDDPGYGFRIEVMAEDIDQRTRFHRDPWGYFRSIEKGYPDKTRLDIFFLDDENLEAYRMGSEFFPAAILNLSKGGNGSVILSDAGEWHMVIPGMARPLSRTFLSVRVNVSRSIVHPKASILSPLEGTYDIGELLEFEGVLEPSIHDQGDIYYIWKLKGSSEYLSTERTFSKVLPQGDHIVELHIFNGSGLIDTTTVSIMIIQPNRPPIASIDGLESGAILEFGTTVHLSGRNSTDPDDDPLTYLWRDENDRSVLSENEGIDRNFQAGDHHLSLTVEDPDGLKDTDNIHFSIMDPNTPPIPFIESPLPWSIYQEEDEIEISAEGTYDLDDDPISYRWEDDLDGNVSNLKDDTLTFSTGIHRLTLFVSDGKETSSTYIQFHVIRKEIETDLEPIAIIFSPRNGQRFNVTDPIELSSLGSYDPEGKSLTYQWSIDVGSVSNEAQYVLTLSEGMHTITLTVGDGVFTNTVTAVVIVVDRTPVMSLKVNGTDCTGSGEIIFLEGENVTFDASDSMDPEGFELQFYWMVGDRLLSDKGSFNHSFDAGIYYLRLEVSDVSGRTVSKVLLLRVLSSPSEGLDDNKEEQTDEGGKIPLILYLIPLIIIMLSLSVIIFVLIRSKQMNKDHSEENE